MQTHTHTHAHTHLSKEDNHVSNKYMKGWSTPLIIRKMQIKQLGFHLTAVRITNISKKSDTHAEGIQQRGPSFTVEKDCNVL